VVECVCCRVPCTVASWITASLQSQSPAYCVNGCSAPQWLQGWHHRLSLPRLFTCMPLSLSWCFERAGMCEHTLRVCGASHALPISSVWSRSSALVAIVTISWYRRGLCHDITIHKKSTIRALIYTLVQLNKRAHWHYSKDGYVCITFSPISEPLSVCSHMLHSHLEGTHATAM